MDDQTTQALDALLGGISNSPDLGTAFQALQGMAATQVQASTEGLASNDIPAPQIGVSNGYGDMANAPGIVEPGNLDLTQRQIIDFPNGLDQSNSTAAGREEWAALGKKNGEDYFPPGSYGSEFSATVQDGAHEVLVPTIFGGVVHSTQEAYDHYKATGLHMGKFDARIEQATDFKMSNTYSTKLHQREIKVNGSVYKGKGGM